MSACHQPGNAATFWQETTNIGRVDGKMPGAGFGDAEASMTPMQRLRAEAQNMKLDMTDALEEYAGSGYEKNMGVMDKNRFRSTLGVLCGRT